MDAVAESWQGLGEGSGRHHVPLLVKGRDNSLMAVDFTFRSADISAEDCVVLISIYLGHDDCYVPIDKFSTLIAQQFLHQVVSMHNCSKVPFVPTDNY